jgi:H(+)-transporting ATP synthase subunit D
MELIKTKERINLAKKGHKLLKQKRDALILEFFKILKKSQDLRGALAKRLAKAYHSLAVAQSYHSSSELAKVSFDLRRNFDLDIKVRNVMGVRIPSISLSGSEKKELFSSNYSFAGTSSKIDAASEDFNEILDMVIRLAETETAMKRLIAEIEKGIINFDILLAEPQMMPKLARVARVLGPKGLMPNPKNGTVTEKTEEASKKYAGGQVNFKTESKNPLLHLMVGKVSFGTDKLAENITAMLAAVKKSNIVNVTLKSTMSPGIKIKA